MTIQTLSQEKEEIKLLMKYAVPEEHLPEAEKLLCAYEGDRIALNIFHSFYSYLPEAKDDVIRKLLLLKRRQGTFLVCAATLLNEYLYLATFEAAEFLGTRSEGIWDREILEFYGFKDRESFLARYEDPVGIPVYKPAYLDGSLCPVCHADEGEFHTLGCPVEVCPWCGGQLTRCNCRFEQLSLNKLARDSQLKALKKKIEETGRIAFNAKTQRPGFPSLN